MSHEVEKAIKPQVREQPNTERHVPGIPPSPDATPPERSERSREEPERTPPPPKEPQKK